MPRRFMLMFLALGFAPALAAGTDTAPASADAAAFIATAPAQAVAVALTKHDAGTFYVDGQLQGYGDLSLLLDTGSSYLVINESILAVLLRAGKASYARELDGRMADGSRRVIPVYRVSSLRIGRDCWIHDIEAAVFPATARPILGMNILSRLAPFTFTTEPPALAVNSCQAALTAGGAVASGESRAPLAP